METRTLDSGLRAMDWTKERGLRTEDRTARSKGRTLRMDDRELH